ncbi:MULTISPECIES: putative quinol monooxygenase [Asaia]|uniref:Antibiotic biosynthesis monooxygenase n=1 Tax=Asaia bogorensis TaxID=91915 RepID=A0A060QD03_9PROT|nr:MULTISPECIES: putative quinol monooxygenase [Asaia]ETC99399.1 antibiotic biosynthesis monooxygenase [Asaia sp. SF2.1]MDL2171543.1 putative quinol monooxygenase [Asaia sp. HumB]CDG38573.1 Antibiotic biosynthesis monooxygenase [Asaia bogorensis]
MSESFTVIAEFAAPAENFDKFLEICRYDSDRSLADEEGCLAFDVLTQQDAPDIIVLHEVYTGRAAFEAHLKTPHFEKFAAALREFGIEERNVRLFTHRHP